MSRLLNYFLAKADADRQREERAKVNTTFSSIFEAQDNPDLAPDVKAAFLKNIPRAIESAQNAGMDPNDLLNAYGNNWKLQEFQRLYGGNYFTPEQKGALLTGHDISPVRVTGNTAYNRFTGDMQATPVGQSTIFLNNAKQQTEVAQQGLYGAQTQTEGTKQAENIANTSFLSSKQTEQDYRNRAIQEVINNPDANPLLKLDFASNKPIFKSENMWITQPDGQRKLYTKTQNLAGGFDIAPAKDKAGQDLIIPVTGGKSAGEKQYQFQALMDEAMQLYDISRNEALDYVQSQPAQRKTLTEKWKGEGRLRRDIEAKKHREAEQKRFQGNSASIRQRVDQQNQFSPKKPPPDFSSLTTDQRNALTRVKADIRAGRLTFEQGAAELKKFWFK